MKENGEQSTYSCVVVMISITSLEVDPKMSGAIGIKAVHMRAVGKPSGEMASAEVKVIHHVRGASPFRSRVERRH